MEVLTCLLVACVLLLCCIEGGVSAAQEAAIKAALQVPHTSHI